MPPLTRNQSKKTNTNAEPYSIKNFSSEKRNALLDIVSNNNVKKVVNEINVKKLKERVCANDNISKTENVKRIGEKSRAPVFKKIATRSRTKEATCPCSNDLNNITLLKTSSKDLSNYTQPDESVELFTTAIDDSQCFSTSKINYSELFQSAVEELNVTENLFEIDQTDWNNFVYVGCYARDIFKYLNQREDQFIVTDYISLQSELTTRHRAIVVNWLVTLQDYYGLNHEVLYMAVKLIDLYLMKNIVIKDQFQLLASSALLVSIKIDEREPGFPNELVKQCNYIFTEDELFIAEREMIKALNFDINVPLSYVFLRRFARCMKSQMVLLTLARYILEYSLLEYRFVTLKDSLKAAAALYLAFKMSFKSINSADFQKYTGYSVLEIKDTVISFNNMLHNVIEDLCAVKEKYMHKTFYRVACTSLLNNSVLSFD